MYFKNQRYDYYEAAKIADLVPDHWITKQDIDASTWGLRGNKREISKRCRAVFIDFLGLVIKDCIENNVRFYSPGNRNFQLFINEKPAWETEKIYKKIKKVYRHVDLIGSDGKIYQFVLYSRFIGYKAYRPVRIGQKDYRRIVELVNAGKRYFERNEGR